MTDDFLNSILQRIFELKSFKKKTIFSISTTAKKERLPYLTPVRVCEEFVLGGCVVFDKKQLSKVLDEIDGKLDIILADSEKTISLDADASNFGLVDRSESFGEVSISNVCFQAIKKSQTFEFKPNDLTVNAAWSFLSQKLIYLNGKKICILGAGNIGSKLALKLVECGAEVFISRRDMNKGNFIATGLNLIKPHCVNAKIHSNSELMQVLPVADVLIGASRGASVIDENIVKGLGKDCLIVDLGKNNLTKNAIKIATEHLMNIYRTDVTPAIESFVYEVLKTQDIVKYSCGKKDLGFCNIVSGGYFGRCGDIVVDNIRSPSRVLGVAQGNGLLKPELNSTDQDNIFRLKNNLIFEQ